MNRSASPQSDKLFSVEEANRTLPLVRAIVRDLVELSSQVVDRSARTAHLTSGRDLTTGDPYSEELAIVEEQLRRDTQRIEEFTRELRQLGIEPRCLSEGCVDFPTTVDGHAACLCWKLGEDEILYWHKAGEGDTGRKRLTADALAHPGAGGELFE